MRLLNNRHGIKTGFQWNNDGTYTIATVQDVEPFLDANKAMAPINGKKTRGKDMFHVAQIPVVVQYEWLKRYGIRSVFDEEYEPLIKRLLNSSEWRYLRTSEIIL